MTIIPLTEDILNSQKIYHNNPVSQLKIIRKKRQMTQQQLAYKAHISVTLISMYERGLKKIPLERKKQFANLLSCEISDIE